MTYKVSSGTLTLLSVVCHTLEHRLNGSGYRNNLALCCTLTPSVFLALVFVILSLGGYVLVV